MNQPELDFTGKELRDIGMKIAEDHANEVIESWSDRCYELLKEYLKINKQPFQTEFFRMWCIGKIGEVNARAYGGVMMKAAKRKLIQKIDCKPVSNPRAHCANASVWVAI